MSAQRRRLLAVALALATAAVSAATGAAAGTVTARWVPPQQLTWYWQLTGAINTTINAQAYDVDGFSTSAAQVAALHAAGRRVICYIDVGTWERFRPDAHTFPKAVIGRPNGWPGERWLDVRALGVLEPIIQKRLQMCASKGFDAVEPDNIDGFENRTGFPITASQQLSFDEWVAGAAHALGLAVFQKNDPEQARTLEPYFDGVLDEQCNQYSECGAFAPYLSAGKPVLNAEYATRLYPGFCSADARLGITGVLYNLALDGRVYKPCWAASGPALTPRRG